MPRVILDPSKLAEAQPDLLEIKTEMDFLRHSNDEGTLLIRGSLCAWAELYYLSRGIPVTYAMSRAASIMKVCPVITEAEVEALIRQHGTKLPSTPPLTLADLLQKICPAEVWMGSPSVEHLATYLLWLWKNDTEESLHPLLRYQTEQWEKNYAGPAPLPYHRAYNKTSSLQVLDEWLGINPSSFWRAIGTFPKPVPQDLRNRAIDTWKREIITSEGKLFYDLHERNLPFGMLRDAGSETAQYFIAHHKKLNQEVVGTLEPYIPADLLAKLRNFVQPNVPGNLPENDFQVAEWFIKEYLPYRVWQLGSGEQEAKEIVTALARQFGEWYLKTYPEMLLGHPLQPELCYQKMGALTGGSKSEITLVLLLDGLSLIDSRELIAKVQEQIPKLKIRQSTTAYSALPTVTEFCKEALIRGVPPKYIDQTSTIGQVISAGRNPAQLLANAELGQTFIWSIIEPDETYHKFADKPVLARNVEAQLDGVVKKLHDVLEEIPADLPIQVIITSDHGRLLTSSHRQIPIPEGMISHGRAAWGPSAIKFLESGFTIRENVAYLNASRYGLLQDAVLPLDEGTFLTSDGKKGHDNYSHGGLYPEEVFVPWVELARDVIRPMIEIHIQGEGTAEMHGTLSVTVLNLSDDQIDVESLEVVGSKFSQLVNLDWSMPARDQVVREVPVSWWPTTKQAESIKGQLAIRDHNGIRFTYPCALSLQVKEMYTTSDTLDIFDDLP